MKKPKTNEQMFKALFKEIHGSMLEALLRERVVKIMEITIQSIEESPEQWENSFIGASAYKKLNEVVQKHIGFND
jgi:hypothetical protein